MWKFISSINDVIPNNNYLNAALHLQEGAVITAIMIEKVNQKEIKERVDNKIQSYKSVYSKIIQENFYKNREYINGASLIESDEKSVKILVTSLSFFKNNRFNRKIKLHYNLYQKWSILFKCNFYRPC